MSNSLEPLASEGTAVKSSSKTRLCLRCESPFLSGWAGERICPDCKKSTSWRNGTPHRQRLQRPQTK